MKRRGVIAALMAWLTGMNAQTYKASNVYLMTLADELVLEVRLGGRVVKLTSEQIMDALEGKA